MLMGVQGEVYSKLATTVGGNARRGGIASEHRTLLFQAPHI